MQQGDEIRQPEAPMGWPRAMAPPLTLTFCSQPVLADRQRLDGKSLVSFN
jgi:hypothetical protein